MRGPAEESEPWVRLTHQLALGQEGVFGLRQAIALGINPRSVQKGVAARHVYRIHHGVYGIAPPSLLSLKGRYLAAVLAFGDAAALSHRSAADLWGIRKTDRRAIDVIVPRRGVPSRQGIDVHCSLTLTPADITIIDAIPVTTVARTTLDLAAVVTPRQTERALDQAEAERLFDLRALTEQVTRNPKHPGAPILGAILATHTAGSTTTWSELEELCLSVTRAAGLPAPEVNVFVDPGDGEPPIRADFVWRTQRVIVEADGFQTHGTHGAFEDDRRRDQRLQLAGWIVVRVTWRQLRDEAERIAATLIGLLTRQRARPRP
jgi:hypothetical protein